MTLTEMINAANAATQNVEVNSTNAYTPIPNGVYLVAITNASGPIASKRANPQNPNEFGQFLKLEFTVIDGEYANRKLWCNNNILVYPRTMNEDDIRKAQVAMAMGAKERNILLASVGKVSLEQAEELIGASVKVKVAIEKNMNGDDTNVIKAILPAETPSVAPVAPTPTSTTTKAMKAKMPWEK